MLCKICGNKLPKLWGEPHTCQAPLDDKPLPVFRTEADERIAALESENAQLRADNDELKSHLKVAISGLTAISLPEKLMQNLDMHQVSMHMKDPDNLKDIAAKTLMKIYGVEQ